jgi:hypothetical protein
LSILATALGLIELKDTPVTCSDTVLLASPRLCEIVAAFFSGKNDVPHPDRTLLVPPGLPPRKLGKGFNQWIRSAQPATSAGFSLDFNSSVPLEDYSKPAIQSHKGRRSSSSSANCRMSLLSLMAFSSRSLASTILPLTQAYQARVKAILATLGCIACARTRTASAFSTPSICLTECARFIHQASFSG